MRQWVGQKRQSKDPGLRMANGDEVTRLLRNAYRVLLTRGMRGTRVLCLDQQTREHLVRSTASVLNWRKDLSVPGVRLAPVAAAAEARPRRPDPTDEAARSSVLRHRTGRVPQEGGVAGVAELLQQSNPRRVVTIRGQILDQPEQPQR
jgi:Schlafen group 3, DNA/RNA helicase domain